jgi:short-subunit dehydrogenase
VLVSRDEHGNNAGTASVANLLDSKIDDLEAMIDLNVTALTRLALAALRDGKTPEEAAQKGRLHIEGNH